MTAYKIAVLSNANSPHTIKIANSLIENNVNVIVISQKDHRDTCIDVYKRQSFSSRKS